MHGLWNNIKSSVGETIDNIISSPRRLRKRASKAGSITEETSAITSVQEEDGTINTKKTMSADQSAEHMSKNLEEEGDKSQRSAFHESNQSMDPEPRAIPRMSTSSSSGSITTSTNNTNINTNSVLKPKINIIQPKRTNTLGNIGIGLVNDDGEHDAIEIDIADSEKSKEEDKILSNARRQSISDRINRRRTSELAAEIIRLSAEHRKKEFFELLNEHEEIVKGIEVWKTTGVLPLTKEPKRSNLETVEDEDIAEEDDEECIDEDPFKYSRRQDNNFYISPDDKENKTLSS